MSIPTLKTRDRLSEVRYEIRGELARRARELEGQGRTLIKLNIGNPGAFGFRAPEHLQRAIADHIHDTDPYTHQQGLPAAREAIAAFHKARGTPNAHARARVHRQRRQRADRPVACARCSIPATKCCCPRPTIRCGRRRRILNDGRPVYYRCHAGNGFLPDPDEIEALVSPRTRAIVLINPNNPTGAAYPRELLERIVAIAARHNLLLMSDEIYDAILYDDATFQPLAPLAGDVPCLSFGGLSKVHRACGWRVGWAVLSRRSARDRRLPPRDGPARRAAPVRQRAGAVRDRGGAARRRHDHAAVRARRPPVRGAPRGDRDAARRANTSTLVAPPARCTRSRPWSARPRTASTTMPSRWRCSKPKTC